MRDFLTFRRMLTPKLIQLIFWVAVLSCLVLGVIDMFNGSWANGLQFFFIAPILIRISCEFVILFFRMNETLTDIKNNLKKDQ